MTRRGSLFLCFVGLGACTATNPPKDAPHAEHVDAAAVLAAPSSSTTAAAPPGCAADNDCRTAASYCTDAPCACRVLNKGESAPRCNGAETVRCLVDPCGKKSAVCQEGHCVLVTGAVQ